MKLSNRPIHALEPGFIDALIKNILSLYQEAKILSENGFTRRATFLAMTSYEELMKLTGILKKKKSNYFNHNAKFAHFAPHIANEITDKLKDEIEKHLSSQGLNSDQIKEVITGMPSGILERVKQVFDFSAIRQSLLYEDPKPEGIRELTLNPEIQKSWLEFFLHLLEKDIPHLQTAIEATN